MRPTGGRLTTICGFGELATHKLGRSGRGLLDERPRGGRLTTFGLLFAAGRSRRVPPAARSPRCCRRANKRRPRHVEQLGFGRSAVGCCLDRHSRRRNGPRAVGCGAEDNREAATRPARELLPADGCAPSARYGEGAAPRSTFRSPGGQSDAGTGCRGRSRLLCARCLVVLRVGRAIDRGRPRPTEAEADARGRARPRRRAQSRNTSPRRNRSRLRPCQTVTRPRPCTCHAPSRPMAAVSSSMPSTGMPRGPWSTNSTDIASGHAS